LRKFELIKFIILMFLGILMVGIFIRLFGEERKYEDIKERIDALESCVDVTAVSVITEVLRFESSEEGSTAFKVVVNLCVDLEEFSSHNGYEVFQSSLEGVVREVRVGSSLLTDNVRRRAFLHILCAEIAQEGPEVYLSIERISVHFELAPGPAEPTPAPKVIA